MKEVVFDQSPVLDSKEKRIADLHSVFNILNVLTGELSLLELDLDSAKAERLIALQDEIASIAREIQESEDINPALMKVRESENAVIVAVRALIEELTDATALIDARESLSNIESVYCVVRTRLDELEARSEDPNLWIAIQAADFDKQFREVFYAIEKKRQRALSNLF